MKKILACLLITTIFNVFAEEQNVDPGNVSFYTHNEQQDRDNDSELVNLKELAIKINNLDKEIQLLRNIVGSSMLKLDKFLETSKGNSNQLMDDTVLEHLTNNDEEDYKRAYQEILNKEYSVATKLFSNFLYQHPDSNYLPNAYYWLGELYLREKNYEKANKNFNVLINKYHSSTKVPSAMLKRACGLIGLKKLADAEQQLKIIINNYPNTTAALIANKKLANLAS